MGAGNPVRDDAGNVPFISMTRLKWAGWLGLNTDVRGIPRNHGFYEDYDTEDRDLAAEVITPSGRLEEMDWGAICDWFRSHYPWRGHIPTKDPDGEFPCPELLDFDEIMPTIRSQRGQWYIPIRIAISLAQRLTSLEDLVQSCAEVRLGDDIHLPRPPPCSQHSLNSVPFNSETDLRRATTAVKRAIADRMGWLAWFRAFVPQSLLRDRVPIPILTQLLQETRTEYRKRGLILHLANCWSEVNIPFWLTEKIPIYYCWRFEERCEPQLTRMHPKLLAGDTSQDRVALFDGDDDEDFLTAARMSKDFDDFFQRKTPEPRDEHLSFELDATFFIIDFQGWGRRPLSAKIDPSEYANRFFFRILEGEDKINNPRVIFWRWRKKPGFRSGANRPTLPVEEADEGFLREAYRFDFAPRKGRCFDEETGAPKSPEPDDQKMDVEPFADHRRDPDQNDSSSDFSDSSHSDSSHQNSGSEDGNSLFARLGLRRPSPEADERPYSSIANITAWRNMERQDEIDDRPQQSRSSIGQLARTRRSSRSPSPRRAPANDFTQYQRPLVLFRRKLKDLGHIISHDDFRNRLPYDFAWNPTLLEKGVLLVNEKRAEVRLRYLANALIPGIHGVGSLLKAALEKRLEFKIAIHESDISLFSPSSVTHANRINGSYIYGTDFADAPLEFKSPTEFAATYIARVGELLRRPHAAAFIGLGGACSWLAQRWGGDEIVARFMRGPSIQTTVFRKGA